jgi:hypothetical protein
MLFLEELMLTSQGEINGKKKNQLKIKLHTPRQESCARVLRWE